MTSRDDALAGGRFAIGARGYTLQSPNHKRISTRRRRFGLASGVQSRGHGVHPAAHARARAQALVFIEPVFDPGLAFGLAEYEKILRHINLLCGQNSRHVICISFGVCSDGREGRQRDVLQNINTIVILMMEGRSFDHLLGHLSLSGGAYEGRLAGLSGTPVDGFLRDERYASSCEGRVFYPFEQRDGVLPACLQEDRLSVAISLGRTSPSGERAMDGFVRASRHVDRAIRAARSVPMGFLRTADAPVTSFLARNYAICDQYFAPLPSGTVPNRLMAMSGASFLEDNSPRLLPHHSTVFDWMRERGVRYRVYHDGVSFFALCPWMHDEILSDRFREASRLGEDFTREPDASFPEVVFVEPSYGAAPVQQGKAPNDNRAPSAMAPGERFLLKVYEALTSNPERFSRTLFLVTYASHGGFYDHVAPPSLGRGGGSARSMGVRVPSLVISPWVAPNTVYSGLLDHTSILQLIAERFGDGHPYSDAVRERAELGVGSLSQVINLETPRAACLSTPRLPERRGRRPRHTTCSEAVALEQAFYLGARALCERAPSRFYRESPELWRAVSFSELH